MADGRSVTDDIGLPPGAVVIGEMKVTQFIDPESGSFCYLVDCGDMDVLDIAECVNAVCDLADYTYGGEYEDGDDFN